MKDFAKLFETEIGQVLIICDDCKGEITIMVRAEVGLVRYKMGYDEAVIDKMSEFFDGIDAEGALKGAKEIIEALDFN